MNSSANPERPDVRLCEMVPRDGLQTLSPEHIIPARTKADLVHALIDAGFDFIEVGSFVSTRAVPQMATTDELARLLDRPGHVDLAALVPNLKHYERFCVSGLNVVALFVSASERYSQFNLRQSIAESKKTAADIARAARDDGFKLRAHLSACFQDIDGTDSDPAIVTDWTAELLDLGCDHVALADTKGTTHPDRVREILDAVDAAVGLERIAVHFHDSFGQGIANCVAALDRGVRIFDASVGGIGGTPFKARAAGQPGGGGNVATEELAHLLDAMNHTAGIDLQKLLTCAESVAQLCRSTGDPPPPSKLLR